MASEAQQPVETEQIGPYLFEIPKTGRMRVPGRIYASPELMALIKEDRAPEQVRNVACLPGIVNYSLAMPDIHWGYGFPIGGVAAMDPDEGGVVSPGGIGYDINCLSGDTPVLLAGGHTRPIAAIVEQRIQEPVLLVGSDGRLTSARISGGFRKPAPRDVLKLTTREGRTIRATGDHPFLTPWGMQELGGLTTGDRVAVYSAGSRWEGEAPAEPWSTGGSHAGSAGASPSLVAVTPVLLLERGLTWEQIADIRPVSDVGNVYDITIDHPEHNFIANGFVVHNCGVRLIRTNLDHEDVAPKVKPIIDTLYDLVPSGVGSADSIGRLNNKQMKQLITRGAPWAIEQGYGSSEDLAHIEEEGCIDGADPAAVSKTAYKRGAKQLGTLGSGNHFLEMQVVDEVYLPDEADALGLFPGCVCFSIHCGSRGFGYQVCDDNLQMMLQAARDYEIWLPDRQLCCAPLGSPEADRYLGAMACAANYAFANRQVIRHHVEQALLRVVDIHPRALGLRVVYDVCHNIGKFERHEVSPGQFKRLFVHRKGATRAFGPGHPQTPEAYRETGQPVLIPGDMGRYSYVLVGTAQAMSETWGSSCHGAGRVLSRKASSRRSKGRDLVEEMARRGVYVNAKSYRTLAEEMPHAYKDVKSVVEVMARSGISRIVAKLRPIGVTKG